MSIGLARGTVRLDPHCVEWEVSARNMIQSLRDVLQDQARDIQHIGSTSIRTIKAKPIIDIAVGMDRVADIHQFDAALAQKGIIFRREDIPGQLLYVVGSEDTDIRTHHIHIVEWNSSAWHDYINFRDYLNARPEIASEYSELKERLASSLAENRGSYTEGKQPLIRQILRYAARWREFGDLSLIEFDPDPSAVIDPAESFPVDPVYPKIFISCFSCIQFDRLRAYLGHSVEIGCAKVANQITPIYKATYQGMEIGLVNAEVGASSCVGMFDMIFARGAETVILFGNCGVLDPAIEDCAIILPTSAVRDEGTSFHYAPLSREIEVNTTYGSLFEDLLKQAHIPYHKGKTWTTDGFFRETREKVHRRQSEGCITVDMEAASMAALAQLRGKHVLQFFYAADNLAAPVWDKRSLSADSRVEEKDAVSLLALEAAMAISKAKV